MSKARWFVPLAMAGAVTLATVTGGLAAGASTPRAVHPHATTLRIWLMTGEIGNKTQAAVNKAFEAAHPGVKVSIQIQQWSGISQKITTGIAGGAIDALEIGNTDVPEFAASGALENLTPYQHSLEGHEHWLTGLTDPATVNGHLYGVPLLAGDRAVIYNKQMFAQAHITTLPRTLAALLALGKRLQRFFHNVKDFSGLYFPGQYWYAGLSFLWNDGGAIATHKNGKWVGEFTAPKSLAGLEQFKTFQNQLSTPATRSLNTTGGSSPYQGTALGNGTAAMMIGGGWEPGYTESLYPKLKGKLGAFLLPGTTRYRPAPVFLGGSDIAIANNSPNKALALDWIKLMTSPKYQTEMFNNDGLMPNATQLLGLANSNPVQKVFYDAAKISRGTPSSPGWATIEGDLTMENLFMGVAKASGPAAVKALAQTADAHLNQVLNA